jgi:hypothetical protein
LLKLDRLTAILDRVAPRTASAAFLRTWLLAVAVGFLILFVLAPLTGISPYFYVAYDGYLEIAVNVIRGNGFVFEPDGAPVLHRPPLYPLLLAPTTLLPLPLQRPVLVIWQGAMLGGVGALTFLMAHRLFGLATARVAMLVLWTDPFMFVVVKNPNSVVVQGFLYVSLVALIGRSLAPILGLGGTGSEHSPVWKPAVPIGAAAGALVLTHGSALLSFAILLGAALLVVLVRGSQGKVRTYAIAVLVAAAVIAPWTLRNWLVFDRFIPVAGNAGYAYFLGNAYWGISRPSLQGEGTLQAAGLRYAGIDPDEEQQSVVAFYGITDPNLNARLNASMLDHMRRNPAAFLKKVCLNAVEFYFPSTVAGAIHKPLHEPPRAGSLAELRIAVQPAVVTAYHALLWALCIAGLCRGRARPAKFGRRVLLLLPVAAVIVPYLPFLVHRPLGQYAFPTIPFLCILASCAIRPPFPARKPEG